MEKQILSLQVSLQVSLSQQVFLMTPLLINFIFDQISLFIWKLGRSDFMLYPWSINKFNFVTRDYWKNVWVICQFPPLSYMFFKLTTKDLKVTILFCIIFSGVFTLASKARDLDLIGLSLKKSFVCNILCFQHNSYFWSNWVFLLVWNQVY